MKSYKVRHRSPTAQTMSVPAFPVARPMRTRRENSALILQTDTAVSSSLPARNRRINHGPRNFDNNAARLMSSSFLHSFFCFLNTGTRIHQPGVASHPPFSGEAGYDDMATAVDIRQQTVRLLFIPRSDDQVQGGMLSDTGTNQGVKRRIAFKAYGRRKINKFRSSRRQFVHVRFLSLFPLHENQPGDSALFRTGTLFPGL